MRWKEVKGKVIRPNVECTNGIIHVVDTVFIDNSPPSQVFSGQISSFSPHGFVIVVSVAVTLSLHLF